MEAVATSPNVSPAEPITRCLQERDPIRLLRPIAATCLEKGALESCPQRISMRVVHPAATQPLTPPPLLLNLRAQGRLLRTPSSSRATRSLALRLLPAAGSRTSSGRHGLRTLGFTYIEGMCLWTRARNAS